MFFFSYVVSDPFHIYPLQHFKRFGSIKGLFLQVLSLPQSSASVCFDNQFFYFFWTLNSWEQVVLKRQPNGSDQYKTLHKRFYIFYKFIRFETHIIIFTLNLCFQEFPFPDCEFVSHAEKGLVKLDVSKRSRRKNSVDWTNYSSLNVETIAPDVIAPSPWKIFGCQNGKKRQFSLYKTAIQETVVLTELFVFSGLRLFKEAKDWDSRGRVMFICTFYRIRES